jgi:hypothetical protein
MDSVIYGLCALTATLCAWLQLRAYGHSRYRLLLCGGLCFIGLTISNFLLVVDKVLTPPEVDFSVWRHCVTLISLAILLYGLIWDAE